MKNKVLIYHYDHLGKQIAKLLHHKHITPIICDKNKDNAKAAQEDGFEAYPYSLMDDKEFLSLGIKEDIDTFLCLSDDDSINIFLTLSARNLNKKLKIITLAKNKTDIAKLELAGANKVLNPNEIAGLRIFRLLNKPMVQSVFDNILFSNSDYIVKEIIIKEQSWVNQQYIKNIDIKQFDVIIIGIQDYQNNNKFLFFSQSSNHKINPNDVIVAIGHQQDIIDLAQYLNKID